MRKGEAGQALVVAAITLSVLMLAAALGIDMGYLRLQQRRMQSAADSAALAGAAELQYGDYAAGAQLDAARNGFDSTKMTCTGGSSIAVNTPPSIGPYANAAYANQYVEVILCQDTPTFFMRALGQNFSTVRTRAVARLTSAPGDMYALGPNGLSTDPSNQTFVSASGTVLDNGPLTINTSGGSHTFATQSIGNPSGTCAGAGCFHLTPAPQPIAPVSDPPAFLPTPSSPGTCTGGGPAVFSTDGTTIPAQAYPCGLQIIADGADITFSSGTYSIGGSGLSIDGFLSSDGTKGSVTGIDVTFYVTGNAPVSIESQGVNIGGTQYYEHQYFLCDRAPTTPTTPPSVIKLSAPTDPTNVYSGVLFFQDAADTASSQIAVSNGDTCSSYGSGTNASYLWGALYFPSANPLTLNGLGMLNQDQGCSSEPRFTLVVASSLLLSGDVNVGDADCGSTTPVQSLIPDPIKAAQLVE